MDLYRRVRETVTARWTLPEEQALLARVRDQWLQRAAFGFAGSVCLFTVLTYRFSLRPFRIISTACIGTAAIAQDF